MRRIYESRALHRDDDDPFAPAGEDRTVPQASRWLPGAVLSKHLLPRWLRYWGLTVAVSTPRQSFEAGERIPFTVELHNRLPVPVTIPTESRTLWSWDVDGLEAASHVSLEGNDDERGTFQFDRGERKQFRRHWPQYFQVSASTWEPAEPGEYTLGVALNVPEAADRGLRSETTVRIE